MKLTAAFLMFLLCIAPMGYAQDTSLRKEGWSVLQSLSIGQNLQVDTRKGRSYKGRLDKITNEGLVVTSKRGIYALQSSEIDKVYVLRGRPIVRRTLIGAAVGAGAGAGVGAIAGRNDDWFGPGAWALACGGAGIVVGSIAGLITGVSHKKEIVYRAEPAH